MGVCKQRATGRGRGGGLEVGGWGVTKGQQGKGEREGFNQLPVTDFYDL